MQAIEDGNEQVIQDVKRIAGGYEKEGCMPKNAQDLCHNIFHTLYMGMATQSSKETRSRAKELSKAIGAYHTSRKFGVHVPSFALDRELETCFYVSSLLSPAIFKAR